MRKAIFDTDIGDDIDDALALAYLVKKGDCELLGVTTVFRNVNLRARLAKKILTLLGLPDVPIYSGFGNPISEPADVKAVFCQYEDDLLDSKWAPENDSEDHDGESAVSFMVDSARKYGPDLTIFAVGPYTNIAKAIQRDPEAMKRVGKIVIMGGCFYEHFVEYNAVCDVVAAKICMEADVNSVFVSADATWKAKLDDADTAFILSIENGGLRGYLADLVRKWKAVTWFNPVLHDPLAVYFPLHQEDFECEEVWSEIETENTITKGLTLNRDQCLKYLENKVDGPKRIMVTKSVNPNPFIVDFMHVLFDKGRD